MGGGGMVFIFVLFMLLIIGGAISSAIAVREQGEERAGARRGSVRHPCLR
jgi:hypothetical protein